jgi:hypothetical protein
MFKRTNYFLFRLLFLFVLFEPQKNLAQDTSKWQINSGFGFYEGFHAGAKYNYRPNLRIGLSLGSQFGIIKDQQYYDLTFQHDWTFRKKNRELTSWSLDKKLVFWYLEDKYYKWFVLSMEPAIGKTFILNDKFNIHIDAGPVFMVVLYFKRKTFDEVGWPRYFLGTATIKIEYKL